MTIKLKHNKEEGTSNYRFTILGCGSSGGVPRISGSWGHCDPSNPKNRRTRCSLLIEKVTDQGKTTVLIDTGCDMREQLLRQQVSNIDAVLYTHEHADHVHGIDDLRVFAIDKRERVNVYLDERAAKDIKHKFSYCFQQPSDSPYPPILREHTIIPDQSFSVTGEGGKIDILPISQTHGNIISLGFRVADIAYSADISDVPKTSISMLQNLDLWIVDALRYIPHPTHFNLEDAQSWIKHFQPKQAVLTNMHIDLDYETLKAELPDNIEPAYDGMVIETYY